MYLSSKSNLIFQISTHLLLLQLLLLSHFNLCDPIDSSPLGSSIPGILQARILEWVAISFSNALMHAKSLQSCLTLCDPWTAAHLAPLSTGFSRQEYWSGLPFPSPLYSSICKKINLKYWGITYLRRGAFWDFYSPSHSLSHTHTHTHLHLLVKAFRKRLDLNFKKCWCFLKKNLAIK